MRRSTLVVTLLLSCAPLPATAACTGPPYDLARRFVGTWSEHTVTTEGEVFVGTLRATMEADGCGFSQRFTTAEGELLFVSFGHVDDESAEWRETFVFVHGRVAHYRWVPERSEVIMYDASAAPGKLRRLRITDLGPDSYDVVEEHSTDGGSTWNEVELTRTRRLPESES